MFKGYCVVDILGNLEQMPPVKLQNIEQCINYVMLQKSNVKEVIIEDEDEYIILQSVDGKVVYPKEIAEKFKDL